MNAIATIFKYEWIQFQRSWLLKLLMILIIGCSAYAIYYGSVTTRKQLKNLEAVESINDSVRKSYIKYFDDKALADSIRFGWHNMNSLYDGFTTEEYLSANIAANHPNGLSHLSIGQRDIYPLYRRVTARSLYYDGAGISLDDKYVETNNPHKLLAGNFDLSFVFIYLFPLFIIALCYNIISSEKDLGSFALLKSLPISLSGIVAIRFLFRFCLMSSLTIFLSLLGYLFRPVNQDFQPGELLYWLGIVLMYLVFWFSICWMLVSFQWSSSVTALSLVGCWILFLLIIPAEVNNYISSKYKVSSRTAFVEELNRQVSSAWDLPDSLLLIPFVKDYPEFKIDPTVPLWTSADSFDSLGTNESFDSRYNKKIILWHYYVNKQIQGKLAEYKEQIQQKQNASYRFRFINPAVTTQEALNEIAASGQRYQERFRKATSTYRDSIFALTNKFVFTDKRLTVDDYKAYPYFSLNQFASQPSNDYSVYYILASFSLICWLVVFRPASKRLH